MCPAFRHLGILIALGASTLQAATPIDGELPIELARYFLPGTWYSDLAPGLPDFALPAGLELVGSHDQDMRKQALFRITGTLDGDAAREALAQAIMNGGGWQRFDDSANNAPRGGFVAASESAPPPSVILCHPVTGMLTVASRPAGYVHLNLFNMGNAPCGTRGIMPGRAGFGSSAFDMHTPVLEVDVDTPEGLPGVISGGMSGSPTQMDARAQVRVRDTSPRGLANDFARQMRQQGWRREARWRGDVTAGNSWTRELDDGRRLAASIDVVNLAEDQYSLRLQMAELPREE